MAVLFVLAPTFAKSEEVTLFGDITIGRQLSIPQCPEKYYMSKHPNCYTGNAAYSSVDYIFSDGRPAYLSHEPGIDLRGGLVAGLTMLTKGVSAQNAAFSTLKEKFGLPTSKNTDDVKTMSGGSHQIITAEWRLDGVSILFSGASGALDTGIILVQNAALEEERNKRANRRPM